MLKLRLPLAMATSLATLTTLSQLVNAQAEGRRLGVVHFETSCTAEAQKAFDQGMLYQHSFWYRASKMIFEDALKADPTLRARAVDLQPPPAR